MVSLDDFTAIYCFDCSTNFWNFFGVCVDLTTVLLVNNENNGRSDYLGHYASVRPEVGLLTSTARTFIQEGVTTEYATQVVGTILDNGRLYAQYLKKSSRVLYDNGQQQPHQTAVLPTAITSWVGDNLELQTKSLLESHNDLFNADQPDWQDIDDRLLIDGSAFVGNTDFVGLSEGRKKQQNSISTAYPTFPSTHITTNFSSSSSNGSSSSGRNGTRNWHADVPLHKASRTGQLEENARELEANKVLPIADLPTYTVRNHFSPSGFSTEMNLNQVHLPQHPVSGGTGESSHIYKKFGNNELILNRSPKLYYQQLMGANGGISRAFKAAPAEAFLNRQLSTTTYYGFADFTTIVGDSVIVFSPSTSTENLNLGHVTSIKGEATLDAIGDINKPQVSTVAITVAIAPTLAVNTQLLSTMHIADPNKFTENSINLEAGAALMPSQIPEEITSHEVAYSAEEKATASVADMVKSNAPSSIQFGGTEADSKLNIGESHLTTNMQTLATYSRPSDQEVLEIYASLSRAEASRKSATTAAAAHLDVKIITEQLVDESKAIYMMEATLQSSEPRSTEAATPNAAVDIAQPSTSSSGKMLGGATTIFFEDDPFANFVEPTTTAESAKLDSGATIMETTDVSEQDTSQIGYETTTTSSDTTKEEYEDVDETITIEPPKIITFPNNTKQSMEGEAERDTASAQEAEAQPADKNVPAVQVKPTSKVSVLEINTDDDVAVIDDCTRTSQVFLTQIAQTVTKSSALYEKGDDGEMAKPGTPLPPTFDIFETTKYYCIKPEATIVVTATRGPTDSFTIEEEEEKRTQVQKPQAQDANAAEVTENSVNATNAVSAPKASTVIETTSDAPNESETTSSAAQSEIENEEDANNDADMDVDTELEDAVYSTEEESGEEIELIYKTLYTTYTYLTTFFNDDSKTSISSHTEVLTNVVTSTLDLGAKEIEPTAINRQTTAGTLRAEDGAKMQPQQEDSAGTSKFILPTELESILREGEHTRESSANDYNTINEKSEQATTFLDDNKLLKTYFTTYTYYTTIFVDGETELMSRTEVYTNFVTDSIAATAVLEWSKSAHAPEVSIAKEIGEGSNLNKVNETSEGTANDHQLLSYSTMIRGHATSAYKSHPEPDLSNYTSVMLVTDVRSSSSNGDHHIINQKQGSFVDDQISSESNTDEIRPSATLLLQTSFTTFTYYTTMYNNDATNVISRLETITNLVTETLQASKTESVEEAMLPITYFTTFTYWTKLAKNGEITTLSREETISNIVTPTTLTPMGASIAPSILLQDTNSRAEAVNSANDEVVQIASDTPTPSISVPTNELHVVEVNKTRVFEPTTYYTTYTYYTTSYDGDRAITDSRFETITNLVTPSIIISAATPAVEGVGTATSDNSAPNEGEGANDGITPALLKDTPLLLYDYKKIIDSDGISTLHFTTEILSTIAADGSPSEFISSTSSLYIDEVKKALLPSTNGVTVNVDGSTARQYKTGLVRLIEGTRIGNRTTTLYQSKVIGTFIENRYAQIIESTSSFIFETKKLNGNNIATGVSIGPTLTMRSSPEIEATKIATLDIPAVRTSIADTGSEESATDLPTDGEDAKEDDEDEDGDDNKARLPFQSKKRTFTPVIRPFASRNRPQFAPKKKNGAPSSATIITRLDFTPTITATPAIKSSGRFSTRKGGIYSSPVSSGTFIAATGSSSRRSFGRPIKPSQVAGNGAGLNSPALASTSGFGGGRNRLSPSTRPTLQSSTRRAGVLIRPSSPGSFRPGFSTPYAGSSRGRIKPTGLGLLGQQNTPAEGITTSSPDTSGEEESTTLQPDEGENEETSADVTRRSQNPLLRFRRPINRPAGFTPANQRTSSSSGGAISPRRNPLTARARSETTTPTTTTTTPQPRPRSFQRPQIGNIPGKPRPQNSLFPPRGLLQKQTNQDANEAKESKKDEITEGNVDGDDDSEYDDEDEEDNEDDAYGENNRRRRSSTKQSKSSTKSVALKSQKIYKNSKPFTKSERSLRVRRETTTSLQRRSNFRNRFRRPKLTSTAEERNFTEDVEPETSPPPTTTATRPRTNGRFASRFTGHHSTQAATTTTASTSSHRTIRPTRPTNGRAQFTLREKDTTTTQKVLTRPGTNNFRRPQTAASSRRTPPPSAGNSRRLKSYNNNLSQDTSSRSPSARGRNNLSRTRTTVRGRSRNDYNADTVEIPYDGTITVTHVIPAEVTIPVVNGKLTEYKNVVTAKTSTEVLGPQQYTSFVGGNGQTMLALTREDSSINFGGATEITQFVLHESPTTTVIFTPTTIRGRKTSFSHVIPSTVYSVENVVSTSQPQISANAPLANILLSQLLLGNIGLPAANPLLGAFGAAVTPAANQLAVGAPGTPATPVTEYRTHTSTYVTTVFEGMSTILPVTFQGKKILTTVYDTTAQTITATEFVTDTIVTTPTPQPLVAQVPQVNSLLLQQLLLQQQLQPQIETQQPILHSAAPQLLLTDNLQDLDTNNIRSSNDNDNDIPVVEENQSNKVVRKKSRKSGKSHKRKHQSVPEEAPDGSSVITLYVSGRRPGEFSTILSTVPLGYESTLHKRQAPGVVKQSARIDSVNDFYLTDGSEIVAEYILPEELKEANAVPQIDLNMLESGENHLLDQTQSLESIVGDVGTWLAKSTQLHDGQTARKLLATSALQREALQHVESRLVRRQPLLDNSTDKPDESRKYYNFLV
ncbi:uncharacterized protein LOC118745711 [Rhagoletis pomonella]|uniref:uncharacterized protein LOC118745711 n=1 Tax=Rhagoletis pomonella TaxID=28610 RepID=UPI001786019B|nr:uncharacterized protein LOC118745711 [Rhagoletis pomonella]